MGKRRITPGRFGQVAAALVAGALLAAASPLLAAGLEDEMGRREVRITSAPFWLESGLTVTGAGLPERLERLGYRRVRARPARPGEYFFGFEVFWIYRRAHRLGGRGYPAELLGLELERDSGRIVGYRDGAGTPVAGERAWIEPEVLAESLTADRARRIPIALDEVPEHLWRSVLAAEDARFFEHSGVDARSIARALLKNARAGKVVQGGSTITQQLVKIRDLTPRRRLGRKLSEAVRALVLEAEYDKTEILEAYLDSVYFGHLGGVAVYGVGAASRAYFAKPAANLELGESALLAAMIQGPNRLNPRRHPESALERQRWVLSRLGKLGWAAGPALERARARGLPRLRGGALPAPPARHFVDWVRQRVGELAPRQLEKGRGVRVETTLDPYLQSLAEQAVAGGLRRLRRLRRGGAGSDLSAALVSLDARNGDVLAYVGGDPGELEDRFDRARRARRQPGSAVKPLVLLEAFARCGGSPPLYPARRVADRPVRIDLPSGPWAPVNPGGDYRGVVDVRQALVLSLNTPFVRVARHCGFEAVAERFRESGLELPAEAPPAFVLGAVETSPLAMAQAFTPFSALGRRLEPRPVARVARPSGRALERVRHRRRRVVGDGTAFLVRDLLLEAVDRGTASAARIPEVAAFGKTGTSSEGRDAWLAGGAGSLITVVWVGRDSGSGRLTGGGSAAPLWREFMARAVPARPDLVVSRPREIERRWIEDATGLLVSGPRDGAHADLFRRGAQPPKRRLFRRDRPVPPID